MSSRAADCASPRACAVFLVASLAYGMAGSGFVGLGFYPIASGAQAPDAKSQVRDASATKAPAANYQARDGTAVLAPAAKSPARDGTKGQTSTAKSQPRESAAGRAPGTKPSAPGSAAGRGPAAKRAPAKASAPAKPAATPSTYEVKRGDTLFAIARRIRYEGITINQMVLALYRANPDAFLDQNINQLRVGSTLTVPPHEVTAALGVADAAREVRTLTARRAIAVPVPKVPVPAEPVAIPRLPPVTPAPPKPRLSRQDAEWRYQEGLALERRGNEPGALQAYLEAGESGHGLAQRKLGELYDKGNSAVERDYQESIRWYQKAREQGVEIPKPSPRAPALR